jgi:hypothetical protein
VSPILRQATRLVALPTGGPKVATFGHHPWLGNIRPSSANDAFDPVLWATFVSTTLGLEVPVLSSLPRLNNGLVDKCGCCKTLYRLSRRPHSHVHSSLRCNQGTRLDDICPWPSVSHGWTHGSHPAWGHGKRGPTARRRGDPQLPTRPSGQPEPGFDLSITHDRYGSSSHPLQNGRLTHPQDIDAPLRLAGSCERLSHPQACSRPSGLLRINDRTEQESEKYGFVENKIVSARAMNASPAQRVQVFGAG